MGDDRRGRHVRPVHPAIGPVLPRESTPAIAALHPVNGFLILLIAVWLARDAWRRWQVPRVDEPAEAAPAESATG